MEMPTYMDRKTVRQHEKRILLGLVDYYYEAGHKSDTYQDEETGGIYEHKFAHRLGYELVRAESPPATGHSTDRPPPEFTEACRMLEFQGYVRRMQRTPGHPVKGIWPTPLGLEQAEYVRGSLLKKCLWHMKNRWPDILVAAATAFITSLVALSLAWIFGLFGLRS